MADFGGSQILPKPVAPTGRQVVLGVRAFSVNYADICIRWGLYESRAGAELTAAISA